ncbi:AAA family ATPase [Atopobium sp. oral taxon 416]|uniref:AAA family ATPase n=1 Tax=Atopobium sp. oral taxon 416 TaxID=712157 RepID=UPI001BAE4E22|nr:ATP-binding protein [Atopobium sp. oral taxon 416]QUC03080.1 ATP-binding protein [Atopobium sp. oral taxon 416]
MTASVIAAELGMPLFIVQTDKLITKYLGETSSRLRQIFEAIASNRAVYLFDEFDAIGADRSRDNEVGEMRRILNSFLQFIEADTSESIIIAATNNRKMLDQALFRRFDDVMHYELPTTREVKRIVANRTGAYDPAFPLPTRLPPTSRSFARQTSRVFVKMR